MMAGGNWREAIREAQAGVAEAETQLLIPTGQALESAWLPLERAAGALSRLVQCFRTGAQPEVRTEVEGLSRGIARLRALLEGSAALRLGWARRLATACGYTARGEPALPQMARKVSVVG